MQPYRFIMPSSLDSMKEYGVPTTISIPRSKRGQSIDFQVRKGESETKSCLPYVCTYTFLRDKEISLANLQSGWNDTLL